MRTTNGIALSNEKGILKRNFLPRILNQSDIIGNYASEDHDVIMETCAENERRGKFIRLFPNENFPYYRQFFEEERRND